MLRLEKVSKYYNNNGKINKGIINIELELNKGEFVVITGESGSGKTTLLNVISGVDRYQEGKMYVENKDTSHFSEKDYEDYRRTYIANVFQSFNLINSYSVYRNVELALLIKGYSKNSAKERVLAILEKVGLTEFKNTKVSKLSGGQKQRVAIARAFVQDTSIIVADEPTGNLDENSGKEVAKILKDISKDKLIIVVTHNIEQFEEYATRVITLKDGMIVKDDIKNKVEEVQDDVKVENKTYKISPLNKIRIARRNTFNIAWKFLLLLLLFIFISIGLFAQYYSFNANKKVDKNNNYFSKFVDINPNRIILNKKDKSEITKDDLMKIIKVGRINKITDEDLLIDTSFDLLVDKTLTDDEEDENEIIAYKTIVKKLDGNIKLIAGRMPQKDNDIVLATLETGSAGDKGQYVLNREAVIKIEADDEECNIVGITKFNEEENKYNNIKNIIYVKDNMYKKLVTLAKKSYATESYMISGEQKATENDGVTYTIKPNENVKQGTIVVNDILKNYTKDKKIIGKDFTIDVENPYYKNSKTFAIKDTFTDKNIKRKYGLLYKYNVLSLLLNPSDYYNLYETPRFQISVYANTKEDIPELLETYSNLGYNPESITKFSYQEKGSEKVLRMIFGISIIIVSAVVMIVVAYLIIKLILNARKDYYTILRTLGLNTRNVKSIIFLELFNIATIAMLVVYLGIMLLEKNVGNNILTAIFANVGIKEFLVNYAIIILMSFIISNKYAKSLFDNTIINTLGKE